MKKIEIEDSKIEDRFWFDDKVKNFCCNYESRIGNLLREFFNLTQGEEVDRDYLRNEIDLLSSLSYYLKDGNNQNCVLYGMVGRFQEIDLIFDLFAENIIELDGKIANPTFLFHYPSGGVDFSRIFRDVVWHSYKIRFVIERDLSTKSHQKWFRGWRRRKILSNAWLKRNGINDVLE
jgi:hypothetical protein